MSRPRTIELRLEEHVDRLGAEHPPIDLDSVDFDVRSPQLLDERFGHVLDYMARVELEVDRNVLELTTMLPDPPDVDRRFYAEVWQPQEVRHGQILDELQVRLGREPAVADTAHVSVKFRVLGALAHLSPVQDVVRMLYYLTGIATERSAVLAYTLLHDGVLDLGETAIARTVVAPIRRQEPGHFAFYTMSARGLAEQLSAWQTWLVRRMRRSSFAPVGANDEQQKADFGEVMAALGIDRDVESFATQISRVERELLWARDRGLRLPDHVVAAFREAVELAHERRHD
ncbi:GTP-binding protein LepA [Nocardioides taihuensis]|uniref:GTP-binding protein LepA n=1 Tax=Nocardioides taihuensis TaxID=1835606 RepID=A0ABW0BEB9_9ACTN